MSSRGESRLGRPQPVSAGALEASPEVVAAIAAAVETCWPAPYARAQTAQTAHAVGSPSRGEQGAPGYVWRMSGRWWSKPVARRRDRPWSGHGEHGTLDSVTREAGPQVSARR